MALWPKNGLHPARPLVLPPMIRVQTTQCPRRPANVPLAAALSSKQASPTRSGPLAQRTTTGRVVRWPPDACFHGRCRSVCRRAVSAANAAGQTFACPPLLRLHECASGTNPGTSGRLERQTPRKHGALANSGTGTRTPISRTRTGRHCQLDYPGQCLRGGRIATFPDVSQAHSGRNAAGGAR